VVENCIFIRGKKPTAKIAKQKTNMKSYINKEGKEVVIAEMPDAYLINSYTKYKKNVMLIQEKLITNPNLRGMVQLRLRELIDIKEALKEEVNTRHLFE